MAKIIAIAQHKGGTGKTTTTLNLGFGLATAGKKVLMIDMDAQANLTESLTSEDVDNRNMYHYMTLKNPDPEALFIRENLYLLPSSIDLAGAETEINAVPNRDFILRHIIRKLPGYDFILIDCPPSLGVLTLNSLMCADEVIVPMQAELLPMKGLLRLIDVLSLISVMTNRDIPVSGILITMVQDTVLNRDLTAQLRQTYGEKVFPGVIRRNVAITEAVLSKQSIFEYAPGSNGAKDYAEVVEQVLNR
ncbi:MAG TPA: chromosome partitioning protein ParA [Prolixibacteraceae bacterium]|jgi:chromosome partitioning protein|nr:chromosome partitioning protein ParA [Prolixibacteraceae bacterium]